MQLSTPDLNRLIRLGATGGEISIFQATPKFSDSYEAFCLFLMKQDRNGVSAHQKRKRAATRKDRSTPEQRLLNSMRARMWAALRGKSASISGLPYTLGDLRNHLECQFVGGMSWENYGEWHVDHIRPCASFDLRDPMQFDECWALSNLQPLWAEDNLKKGSKYV